MLNDILICMEEGYLVILNSLESLYQSLYDLFNQNFEVLGNDKFCRVAIGTDSIKARVNPYFKVVLIVNYKDVINNNQKYDPPLLNRFEK